MEVQYEHIGRYRRSIRYSLRDDRPDLDGGRRSGREERTMRLIDADALSKKLCETTIFIKGGEIFQRMINDAPTIEPTGDLISRQDAIDAFRDVLDSDFPYISEVTPRERIESIPSAPDSRQRGEWVWDEDAVDWGIGAWVCNKCGSRPQTWWSTDRNKNPLICAGSRFCGNCGTRMYKGGEDDDKSRSDSSS